MVLAAAAVLVVAVSVILAALLVLGEAARQAKEPLPPVYDPLEVYDWVVERLPDLVAATLTPDDVRRILDLHMEYFESLGMVGNGSRAARAGRDVVIGDDETVRYILERARRTGEEYLPEQVRPVAEIQWAYLRAIGALGGPAGSADAPSAS